MQHIGKIQRWMSFREIPEIYLGRSPASNSKSPQPRIPSFREVSVKLAKATRIFKKYCTAHKSLRLNDKSTSVSLQECYESLKGVLKVFIEHREFLVASSIYKLLAEVALMDKDYPKANTYFAQIEAINSVYGKRNKQALAFESMGKCYLKMKDYANALKAFKAQLKFGWISDNKDIELLAYDNIGMAYFYMGDLDGAEYYHKRMINCIAEPKMSPTRIACIGKPKKAKNKTAFLGRTNMKYTQILQIFALSPSEKADMLHAEVELHKRNSTTPRVTVVNPVEQLKETELPSPRKAVKLGTDPMRTKIQSLVNVKTGNAAVKKRSSLIVVEKQQNRAIAAKLKQITTEKNKLMETPVAHKKTKSTDYTRIVSSPRQTVPTPKIYISHLSSARRISSYVKYEENNLLKKTFKKIDTFPVKLLNKYKNRKELSTPTAKGKGIHTVWN